MTPNEYVKACNSIAAVENGDLSVQIQGKELIAKSTIQSIFSYIKCLFGYRQESQRN